MRIRLSYIIILSLISFNVIAFSDSIFFYNPDGSKNWWYIQQDMIALKFKGSQETSIDDLRRNSLVDEIDKFVLSQQSFTAIKFTPKSTLEERKVEIEKLKLSENVNFFTSVVTKNILTVNDHKANEYVLTNDIILVNFFDNNISDSELDRFMSVYHLDIYHKPSQNLPKANWTYGFKINSISENTFQICQKIARTSMSVKWCAPDMKLFKPSSCDQVAEWTNFQQTNVPDNLWHIHNSGKSITNQAEKGIDGADAKICECWNEGFHGEGVKIAVIDFGGFDYTHPDLQGQFLKGWNLINSPATSHFSSFWDSNASTISGHGMAVSSIIAANANGGGTYSAVGVAYHSKIIPLLINGDLLQVVQAIQKAIEEEADIINISFGYNDSQASSSNSLLSEELQNAYLKGRNGLGTIIIGSVGNGDKSVRHFPAADTIVFGVGATDPNDFRASYSNFLSWGWSASSAVKGSNYLIPSLEDGKYIARYNVVAPGTRIFSAWTKDPLGFPVQSNGAWTGSSFSAPIVSGIAAILLSKNQGLTSLELKQAIQNGTDRIKPTTYEYTNYSGLSGYNHEVFYGRVNCFKSLNNISLTTHENNLNEGSKISIVHLSSDEILVEMDEDSFVTGNMILIYDVSGKLIFTSSIFENKYLIQTHNFSKGLYFIRIQNHLGQSIKSTKFLR